jgi:O-antigen ligase
LNTAKDMNNNSPRHKIHDRIFYYCCIAFVFFLPVYGRMVPPIIGLMVLNWIIDGRFIKNFPLVFKQPDRFLTFSFSFFYLIYLVGMSYSHNMAYGWFDLEIKLSLFIFPLIFSTLDESALDLKEIRHICGMFVMGCVTGSLVLLIHAFYTKMAFNMDDAFVYTRLSWSFHPGYLAMYFSFAIAILADFTVLNYRTISHRTKAGMLILVMFLVAMIFLLSSKAGVGSLMIITVLYILYVMLRKKMIKAGITMIILSALSFYAAFNIFPYVSGRISKSESITRQYENSIRTDTSSTTERLVIWKTSWGIIKQHFIFGVGTGDVKDELLKNYEDNDLLVIYQRKLNTHNQYLETFIALGVTGFLALLLMLGLPAVQAIRTGLYVYFAFIIIFSFNILVESMLEVQAGVLFYAFFNTLLFRTSRTFRGELFSPLQENLTR